jgi:hypothetical protein
MLDWPLGKGWFALHEGNITQEGRENLKRGYFASRSEIQRFRAKPLERTPLFLRSISELVPELAV